MQVRRILNTDLFFHACGTKKYKVKYQGEWSDMDLITAIDNGKYNNPTEDDLKIGHYGGWVKRFTNVPDEDGTLYAEVHVYYD